MKLFWLPVTSPLPFYILVVIVGGGWAATWFLMIAYVPGDSMGRGEFGDMFGVFTSLMSGLTFAGLVYTILLQRQQMLQQREEISLTRGTLGVAQQIWKLLENR